MYIRFVEAVPDVGCMSYEDNDLTSPSTAAQTSRVQPTSYGFSALAEVLVGSFSPVVNIEIRH